MADLIDKTMIALGRVLDGTAIRQQTLADNIANADTPGYTRKDVNFEGKLREALSQEGDEYYQHMERIANVTADVKEDTASPRRVDGNNVDIEREMATLAKNSLEYETSVQMVNYKFRMLRSAIRDGRG